MAFSITLNELRTQYQDEVETDPKTGIKYTIDSQGNPLIFSPDPGGSPETGFTYEGLKPQQIPGTGVKGEVGPFSGQAGGLMETDILPHMMDPGLAQREADSALISGKAGPDVPPIGTELSRGRDVEGIKETYKDPEGFTRLLPGAKPGEPGFGEPERVSDIEQQKVEAASQRLSEGIKPPGGSGLPETDEIDWDDPKLRDNYKAFIEQKMGGNPNTVNPQEEVMKLFPDSKVEAWYDDNWTDKMPTWYDLSKSAQAQIGAKLRSDLLSQFKQELKAKQVVYDKVMSDFDKDQALHQKALRLIESKVAAGKKEGRAEAASQRAATRSKDYIKNEILKFEKERDESFDDVEKERLNVRIGELKEELKTTKTSAAKGTPEPKGKEKPVSIEKVTKPGKKPGWIQALEKSKGIKIKSWAAKQDESGQKYLVYITEDGKQHALKQTK